MKTLKILPLILLLGQLSSPVVGQERPPIIDMHLHADLPPYEIERGAPALCRPEPCKGEGQATANHNETLIKTLEIMDRNNIVMAHLSGRDPRIIAKWVQAAPNRFIAAPFLLQPGQPTVEDIRQNHAAGLYTGMGEIATQLKGIAPNDPKLESYFALAEELDMPTLIHTAGIGPYLPGFRSAAGSPLLLEGVLVRHPNLRLFLENSGYPYLDDMIAMMYQYPQLY
ncbi:MAG: amidohydrolase family protein, partial [Pseudomonadales bacterium]